MPSKGEKKMKIEDAIEVVLETARKYGGRSVEDCDEIFEATYVVEDWLESLRIDLLNRQNKDE